MSDTPIVNDDAGTALIVVATMSPTVIYSVGEVDRLISEIERTARASTRDMSTHNGRKAIAALAHKIARSKTAIDEAGASLTEEARARIQAINVERARVRERLDALKVEIRAPLTAWENADKARVAAHVTALEAIAELSMFDEYEPAPETIAARLEMLATMAVRDWQEFADRAEGLVASMKARLETAHAQAETREKDEAERIRLHAEAVKQERAEVVRVTAEREATIAREAAERARLAAERAAEDAARIAAERAEAVRQAAVAEAKAAADKAARVAKAAAERAEADRLAAIAERDAAETRAVDAQRRHAAEVEAQRRQHEAALADSKRRLDAERAEFAAEAEQRAAAEAARAASSGHRGQVNGQVVEDFTGAGVEPKVARHLLNAIQRGGVRHVSIAY